MGNVNTFLSEINRRSTSKKIEDLNRTINMLDLIKYGELCNKRINILFKYPWNIYNTNDIVGHKKYSQKIFNSGNLQTILHN